MRFAAHRPLPPLRHFAALFWEWQAPGPAAALERLMPSGEPSLIVNLRQDAIRVYHPRTLALQRTERGAVLLGACSQPSIIDGAEQEHVFGIQFRPGGLWPFLPLPASELTNHHVPLDALWGRDGAVLREQLLEAGAFAQRCAIVEHHLRARLRQPELHPAIGAALGCIQRHGGRGRVSQLPAALGLSQRRFIELFTRQTGLTPKTYSRLTRFQGVLRAAHAAASAGQPIHWAALAADAGYCDQAHLAHEFAGFAALSPTAYAAQAGAHPNHVPVAAPGPGSS